jgi:Tfp pilus assembly protein PilV
MLIDIQMTATQFISLLALGIVIAVALIVIAARTATFVMMARWRNRALQSIASAITAAAIPESEKEKRQHEENKM